jgi:SAM-dependent methyltransferase
MSLSCSIPGVPKVADLSKALLQVAWRLSMRGASVGPHITRYAMYQELGRHRGAMRPGRTLAVSFSRELCDVLGISHASVVEANYPEYDLLRLPFEDQAFDNLVSDQVLEHVRGDPRHAVDEAFRVLKPGGVAVHTTCFMNPIHDAPHDYWRFSVEALRLLCSDAELITAGGWGNRYVWMVDAVGMRFDPVPHGSGHLLHRLATVNDPEWPVVTWVIARKLG